MTTPPQIAYIGLAIAAVALAGSAAAIVDLSTVENKLAHLEEDVEDIPTVQEYDDSDIQSDIDELKSMIPNKEWTNFIDDLAKENRDNLESQTDTLKSQITTLTNKVNSLEAKISSSNNSSSSSNSSNRITSTDMDLRTLDLDRNSQSRFSAGDTVLITGENDTRETTLYKTIIFPDDSSKTLGSSGITRGDFTTIYTIPSDADRGTYTLEIQIDDLIDEIDFTVR